MQECLISTIYRKDLSGVITTDNARLRPAACPRMPLNHNLFNSAYLLPKKGKLSYYKKVSADRAVELRNFRNKHVKSRYNHRFPLILHETIENPLRKGVNITDSIILVNYIRSNTIRPEKKGKSWTFLKIREYPSVRPSCPIAAQAIAPAIRPLTTSSSGHQIADPSDSTRQRPARRPKPRKTATRRRKPPWPEELLRPPVRHIRPKLRQYSGA